MANEGYHEPIEELTDETRDMHRAIISLMEELEAVDWYNQRVDSCKDKELSLLTSSECRTQRTSSVSTDYSILQFIVYDIEVHDSVNSFMLAYLRSYIMLHRETNGPRKSR